MKGYLKKRKKIFMVVWATKFFLSIFLLGSSVFAYSDWLSLWQTQPVVEEKKDLSVFLSRLWERLQDVVQEIVSLSVEQDFSLSSWFSSGSQTDDSSLIDVENSLYEPEILALADLWVIDKNRDKFYPDNYLRRYELSIMLVKYRLAKKDKQLSPIVFPLRGRFFDVAQNSSYAPYVAYAEEQWWIDFLIQNQNGKKLYNPNWFLKRKEACKILSLDLSHSFCTDKYIKRWEFAALLVRGFSLMNNLPDDSEEKDQIDHEDETTSSMVKLDQLKTLFSFVTSR